MNLILEVVSPNGHSLGPARRKVFGPQGGRIGRASDCDWVLTDPYISRHHATVRCIGNTYYIESTGENGVAISTPQAMIPQRERRPLKNGDRLFVDEYEIAVTIAAAAVSEPLAGGLMGFTPSVDPLADLAATARAPVLADPLVVPRRAGSAQTTRGRHASSLDGESTTRGELEPYTGRARSIYASGAPDVACACRNP